MSFGKTLATLCAIGVIAGGGYFIYNQTKQNNPVIAKSFRDSSGMFNPGNGYSLPLNISDEAVIMHTGSGREIFDEALERHSLNNQWTYATLPVIDIRTDKTQPDTAGIDSFLKKYRGDNLANLLIKWAPIVYSENEEFKLAKKKLMETGGIWLDDSEAVVAGKKVRIGRYILRTNTKTANNTFTLIHGTNKRYEIVFTYTDGFSDPENSFDKLRDMKLE